MLSPEWYKLHNLFYSVEKDKLYSDSPLKEQTEREFMMLLGTVPEISIVPSDELEKLFESWSNTNVGGTFEWVEPGSKKHNVQNEAKSIGKDIISFVDNLISSAIQKGASDIHIEPFQTEVRVRYRIFGQLQITETFTIDQHRSVIARLKIMSGLDIAETRRPLDGNIRVANASHQVDIRFSTMPTRFGEKAVMRLLDKSQLNLNLDDLGFSASQLDQIRKAMENKNGLILCTGPTGSGKTTTLYSMLTELNNPDVNILTIEDPIEYELKGINQSQVNLAINLTFASALRAFLRQDPDIIMVGEIRDEETAEIALRAAMTGHLVLSTLHTNSPEGAKQRLMDLQGSQFLIEDTLRLVIGQELVPVIENGAIINRSIKATIVTPE